MIDKEQQNNSLKNSDKNFNENCTHNKEQIMIDGVDVSECIFLDIVNERPWCDNVNISAIGKSQCPYVDCYKNPDCYYKQLARKTQECEELKDKLAVTQFNLEQKCKVLKDVGVVQDKSGGYQVMDVDRYRKALEEIEEYCIKEISLTGDLPFRTTVSDILDIINKVKDGNNG